MSPEIGQWNHTENQLRNIKQVTYINSTLHEFEELEHLKIHVTVFFRESFYFYNHFNLWRFKQPFNVSLFFIFCEFASGILNNKNLPLWCSVCTMENCPSDPGLIPTSMWMEVLTGSLPSDCPVWNYGLQVFGD